LRALIVVGLAIAILAGGFIESMLYGIRPQDPLAIIGAILLLSGAALLAALIPAPRASRIAPALALRDVVTRPTAELRSLWQNAVKCCVD
jgi:putative ABC transport system permease protein